MSETRDPQANAGRPDLSMRQRVYTGLLLFIVIAGLPMIGLPQLRERLSTRVEAFKMAARGDVKPMTLQVGANTAPFPEEFARPEPLPPQPPKLPSMERVYSMDPSQPLPRPTPRRQQIPEIAEERVPSFAPEPQVEFAEEEADDGGGPAITYGQGEAERTAYDLLLKSKPKVAEMVNGSDPSLKFKSWDAAVRGADVYWVRLKFESETNPEAEYIWQVKLQTNEVIPLSHYARTIS